ncbi:hypothetical protein GEMRC1_013802 [Eukaryota sp. GEM-RC1]
MTSLDTAVDQSRQQIVGSEFPVGPDGTVYHLGVKKETVCSSYSYCWLCRKSQKFAQAYLECYKEYTCSRKFAIFTGYRNGVRVSIIGSLMGYPNMDFVVRECRHIIDGNMAIIRMGTSGSPRDDVELGTVALASEGCVAIIRNPDAFGSDPSGPPYFITNTVPPTKPGFIDCFRKTFSSRFPERFREGVGASGCSFYSAQGRVTGEFEDRNETVLDDLLKKEPRVVNLEMETFHLYDMARVASQKNIAVAGAAIVIAARTKDQFIDLELKDKMENLAGEACIDTLISYDLDRFD